MTKITRQVRDAARAAIASKGYDASTMRVSRDGAVTAIKDTDKTLSADATRYLVGDVFELAFPR